MLRKTPVALGVAAFLSATLHLSPACAQNVDDAARLGEITVSSTQVYAQRSETRQFAAEDRYISADRTRDGFRVDEQGRPTEIRVQDGSGFRLLDEAARRLTQGCRFLPARRGEQALASWVEYPVRFALTLN